MALDRWDELLALGTLDPDLEPAWVPLSRAAAVSGASVSALRSWYRSGELPSRLVEGPHGPQREVPLRAAVERAQRSPRLRRQGGRAVALEAELALLRRRVDDLEARLAALEAPLP